MRLLRIGAGKRSRVREHDPTDAVQFVNAPAEHCLVRRGAFGHRLVRYRGGDYTVMGLYYEPRPWRQPRPLFVLRRVDAGSAASASAWSGERRRVRRAHVV